jgi:2-C-methyl-D-erythritol 4-phosphate cytidylyltransferase
VIAAAGSGQRLGAGGPKAFVPVSGRPLVEWSIEACRVALSVRSIIVACPPGRLHGIDADDVEVVDGGATRAESVANALRAVETELVAIHDAARPLVTPELIEAVVAMLRADPEAAGAIPAVAIADTVKGATAARRAFTTDTVANARFVVEHTLDREWLWAAQTPQVFRTAALREALAADPAGVAAATDEAMVVEGASGKVLIYPSTAENLKVTTPLDLKLAEMLLAERAAAGA